MSRIVGLGGGIGASRLWRALVDAVDPAELTLVVNTGDDLWMHGLKICPDIDTTLYALSGRQDTERGWGVRNESFRCMDALRALGHDVWFNLGDLDLATHLLRTGLLRDGIGFAEVTGRVAAAMGVPARVLPMTEQEVTTVVETDAGALHYEEFLVRHGVEPRVRGVRYAGAGAARPAPGVLKALATAEVVVLAPSNPVASIAPILEIPGIRDALRAARANVVAVSPIVSGVPISDPGERRRAASRTTLLTSRGVPPSATGVAGMYRDVCRRFVFDAADADEARAVTALGLEPVVISTLVHRGAPATALVRAVLGGGRLPVDHSS
jgi:LPPG:FO 2-phospho-L-lactate transferase